MQALAEKPTARRLTTSSRPAQLGSAHSRQSSESHSTPHSVGTLGNHAVRNLLDANRWGGRGDGSSASRVHAHSDFNRSHEQDSSAGTTRDEGHITSGGMHGLGVGISGSQSHAAQLPIIDGPVNPAPSTPTSPAAKPASPPVATPPPRAVMTDAPSSTYLVPFDFSPLAAPGERVIFRGDFTDPSPADYRMDYSTTGGHFSSATGAASLTIAGLTSGNINFFVPAAWDGKTALSVTLKVVKISDSSAAFTQTWTFGLKKTLPTKMTQKEGTGEVDIPGDYTYDIGPALKTGSKPFYEHMTILERFDNWSLNVAPADIATAYRKAHSLDSAAAILTHFLGNYAGNNGTFTIDSSDQIADEHNGHPDLSNLVSHLAAPKQIEVALPQTYEAKPGTALGKFMIKRVLHADGTTWKVKKGTR